MKLINIESSKLPNISDSIKECINLGQWMLFKSDAIRRVNADTTYYLKAGSKLFELNDSGEILNSLERGDLHLVIDELFYFSDIPQPLSASNTRLAIA